MSQPFGVRRAAVIGAGVMGAGIAAHLANAGIETWLLDIRPDGPTPEEQAAGLDASAPSVRNRLAVQGLQRALKSTPAAFFRPADAALVRIGNLDDDLPKLADVDWVVEAVIERLDVKQQLFKRLLEHLKPDAVISSNTSGLSCAAIAEALPPAARRRFLVTHFFNPPRYLKLLELVPGPDTAPEVMAALAEVGERLLGKGVVVAKDTPNFIANRIGTMSFMHTMAVMERANSNVAEIDALTGALIGRPKSATFRTADLVGLDVLMHVTANMYERLPGDARRELFRPPTFVEQMVERGMLGAKAGKGFYKKTKQDGRTSILMLDHRTLEYVAPPPVEHASLARASKISDPGARLAALVASDDAAGRLVWEILSSTLHYAATCVPEISDEITDVDRALCWGFGWQLGPFEAWDALGVAATAERLAADGLEPPPIVTALLDSGAPGFHAREGGVRRVFDVATRRHKVVPTRPRVLDLSDLKAGGARIEGNEEATLVDLGDGVACLEFHSKMNTIGQGVADMLARSVGIVEQGFAGLVIGNQGRNFCAGANLFMVGGAFQTGGFDAVRELVSGFQRINQALRFCERPVVVAPHGLVLGGGCEVLLAGDAACAAAESYIGLVEVGVGLIPAGGGCKEMVRRLDERLPAGLDVDLLPFVQRLFETIGMGKVSTSAAAARDMGFLGAGDPIVMNGDHVLHDAKAGVLGLDAVGYRPPRPRQDLRVLGEPGIAAMRAGLWNMREGGMVSDHDVVIGMHLATILCGGPLSRGGRVSEQYLLDLELEAFLALVGEEKTRARMEHTLKTGKTLRN